MTDRVLAFLSNKLCTKAIASDYWNDRTWPLYITCYVNCDFEYTLYIIICFRINFKIWFLLVCLLLCLLLVACLDACLFVCLCFFGLIYFRGKWATRHLAPLQYHASRGKCTNLGSNMRHKKIASASASPFLKSVLIKVINLCSHYSPVLCMTCASASASTYKVNTCFHLYSPMSLTVCYSMTNFHLFVHKRK